VASRVVLSSTELVSLVHYVVMYICTVLYLLLALQLLTRNINNKELNWIELLDDNCKFCS
jgi:heme A synthase